MILLFPPLRHALALTAIATNLGLHDAAAQERGHLDREVDRLTTEVLPRVVTWRRDIHQHPELGNREFRTAALVARHLRSLGMEVRTEVAYTGVIGVLRGARPGPVVALRADMDALPVTELVDLPFASRERTVYQGQEVGVMHACGHDNHVAILMGAAEVLARLRDRITGTVVFIFQPAEEGPPPGEDGGASLMIREGTLANPRPEVIFGLHVWPLRVGTIAVRPEGVLASSDWLQITVRGKQTHGAQPWGGVDPIVVSSQIVTALQTIVSRQVDISEAPAIVTIGSIQGGVRGNIIPDSVVMEGTIRTFDPRVQLDIHERIHRTAARIAESAGAEAEVNIRAYAPVTYNDPALTARVLPTLERVASGRFETARRQTVAEDFAYFQQEIPGVYFLLGIVPEDQDPETAPKNHSPHFYADEGALPVGVKAMTHLALDYLLGHR